MSSKFQNFIFFLILILMNPVISVSAEEAESENGLEEPIIVTLEECLKIASVENIGLKRTRLSYETSLLRKIRQQSVFDPGFEMDLSTQRSESASSLTGGGSSTDTGLNARYRIPTLHGGAWVFSLDQSRSSETSIGNPISADSSERYTSRAGIAYGIPILEGSDERINRIGIERADLDITRSRLALDETARNTRYSIINAYISSVLAAKRIEVARLSLQNAENLVELVEALIEVGQTAEYELLSAQAGLAERQEALLNAESAYKTSLDNLKQVTGMDLDLNIATDPSLLRPVDFEFSAMDYFELARENRPDLKDINIRLEQAMLDIDLASDRTQYSLLWNTTVNIFGSGDDYLGSLEDFNNLGWYTGLQYQMPLGGNREAEVDLETAEIALEQLKLEKEDFLRKLDTEIRSTGENYTNAEARISVTKKGLEVQEVKLENEKARLELGLITARDLLEFDVDLANARYAYDAALADALLALAQLEYLVNTPLLSEILTVVDLLSVNGDPEK